MTYTRSAVLALATAAILCGCSVSRPLGELASECGDDHDNDDDGRSDCEDPDCQAISTCSLSTLIGDASRPPPGQIGDAFVGEVPDAGTDAPPVEQPPVEEPPVEEPPEPEPEPVPGCPDGCGPNQHCVVDRCLDIEVVVADIWIITRIEARVPRSIDAVVTGATCLDSTCLFRSRLSPYVDCTCPPDPRVQVWVDLDPDDDLEAALAGETPVAPREDDFIWSTAIEIRILPTSTVELRAIDVDGEEAEPIFGCAIPEASEQVATGKLECRRMFPEEGAAGAVEFAITAQLAPVQVE